MFFLVDTFLESVSVLAVIAHIFQDVRNWSISERSKFSAHGRETSHAQNFQDQPKPWMGSSKNTTEQQAF